jgi:hypothetical protein
MRIFLDVVDLWQLLELWGRRPIITAFSRLEQRASPLPCPVEFSVDSLMPRLARLKRSAVWRARPVPASDDPARLPMRDFPEACWLELYPEAPSPSQARQNLFTATYKHFVYAQYTASIEATGMLLRALAQTRQVQELDCLDPDALPKSGAPDWIPADLTDEIRGLDDRYRMAEPGTPATYVIAEAFWLLFVKATTADLDMVAAQACTAEDAATLDQRRRLLTNLTEVAVAWNRSPSVVGLCYQTGS